MLLFFCSNSKYEISGIVHSYLCFCCISWITPNLTILGASMWVTHGSSLYKKPASNMPQKILNYMLKWQISIIMMTDFHIEQHNIKRLLFYQNLFAYLFEEARGKLVSGGFAKQTQTKLKQIWILFNFFFCQRRFHLIFFCFRVFVVKAHTHMSSQQTLNENWPYEVCRFWETPALLL